MTMNRRHYALASVISIFAGVYLFRHELLHAYMVRAGNCPSISINGVRINPIVDARTGDEVPHDIAMRGTLIVRDGSFADTGPLLGGAAHGRPGTYHVTVRLPGYRDWHRKRVRVRPRLCSIQTTILRADVQPLR